MMGEVGHIDWRCKHCDARRFTCCECHDIILGEASDGDEMCEVCFRRNLTHKENWEWQVYQEREACAKIAELTGQREIAAAIRGRPDVKGPNSL